MVKNVKDLTGQVFSNFTVLRREGSTKERRALWLCQCVCGQTKLVTRRDLKSKAVKSCGCLTSKMISESKKTHGKTHSRLYRIWRGLKDRCYNKNNKDYKNYGQRGISVCEEWKEDFLNFYNWAMDNGYADNLTIDRIDVNGNYEPSNCRWATSEIQGNNTRVNVYYTYNGKTQSMKMWSKEFGISYQLVRDRHKANPNISFEELFKAKTKYIRIKYKGKEQSLIKWSKELNISLSVLYRRYNENNNIPLEELFKKEDNRKRKVFYKGEFKSIKEWCIEFNLNYNTIKSRIAKYPNYSFEEILKISRKKNKGKY